MPRISRGGVILAAAGAASALAVLLLYKNRRRIFDFVENKAETIAKVARLSKDKHKVLILGLDGSGKSTVLKDLAAASQEGTDEKENLPETLPTQGFKVMHIQKEGTTFDLWEVGGSLPYREYWNHFFDDVDLLVFVVDSAPNRKLLADAYEHLKLALKDPKLADVPVLIVANKQDLPGALTPLEVANDICLDPKKHRYQVVGCSDHPRAHAKVHKLMFQMCEE